MRSHALSHMDRRGFLRSGISGLLGALTLSSGTSVFADTWQRFRKPLKHCILLYMNGGPSHIDTFDPKPRTGIGGPFNSIRTATPGLFISEHLPQVAEQTQHLAVIRSMTSSEGNHNRARYLVHTGYKPQGTVKHPALGSIVYSEVGDRDHELPQFISIGNPSYGGGILGSSLDPYFIRNPSEPIENIQPPDGVDTERFKHRINMLSWVEERFLARYGEQAGGHQQTYAKALRLMNSDLKNAFKINEESEYVRRSYGENPFGMGCLMARRLVESGVTFVEVTLDGWDTHEDNFTRSRQLMSMLDPGFAMLIKELQERHLLDTTMIIWMGEFGRTPRINRNEGRDHYPGAWSAVLAGGGVRGGQVVGQTHQNGIVSDQPVTVPDLFATIATAFGIDPSNEYYTPNGRPVQFVDNGKPVREILI